MEKDMFEKLMISIQEMDCIVKGKNKASRSFEFGEPEMVAIRERKSQGFTSEVGGKHL